jgi:hypothetical protein
MIRFINKSARFTARMLVLLCVSVAFLGVLAVMLTQVEGVRVWALRKGLASLNNTLLGRVEIGSVSGNLITGVDLHDVRLIADSTHLVDAPLIEVHYQLSPIFRDKLITASLVLHEPVIKLVKNARDSVWNFARITKPTPLTSDTSSQTPFPYTIDVQSLEIENAKMSLQDLTEKDVFDTVAKSINYSYLYVEEFNLSAQAHIEPATQSLAIRNLYFNLPRPDIRVIDLSGNFTLDTTGVTIAGFRLETDRTLLNLDARLDSANFFAKNIKAPDAWHNYPVRLKLDGDHISTLELKRFIPDLGFLGGTPSIQLDAQGTYGNIQINKLLLDLTRSKVNLAGTLRNLDHPDSLFIDTHLKDSRLSYEDVPIYVPGLGIPDLRYLGEVDARSAAFSGYPQNFYAYLDATTAIGQARGGALLDLRGKVMKYDADLAVVHANIAPILKDKAYESDFNGRVVASGVGVRPADLNAKFLVSSESSTILGRSYRKLVTNGSLRDNGFLMVDTLLAVWGPTGSPDEKGILGSTPASLEAFRVQNTNAIVSRRYVPNAAERALMAANPSIGAGGWLDMRTSVPKYNVKAQGHRFALNDVLPGQSTTRMTFAVNASGSSFDPDQMQGVAHVDLINAELPGNRPFTPFTADVKLTREGATDRALELYSDLVDLNLKGRWNFNTIVSGVVEGINGIVDYVGRKAKYQVEDPFARLQRPSGEVVNATYTLNVKNLAPLEIFLPGAQIAAEGELHGDVSGTSQLFSITATGSMRRFEYRQDSLSFRLLATQLQIGLHNIAPGRIDDIATAEVSVRSDSLAEYNGMIFNAPRISATLDEGLFRVRGATAINNQLSLALDGAINTSDPEGYRLTMDTVIVALPNGNQWRNVGAVRALIGESEVRIDSLAMQRNRAEVVTVTGALAGSELRNVQVTAQQGSLRDLSGLLAGSDAANSLASAGGLLRQLQLTINGTLEAPAIAGTIAIDSLSYGGSYIGNLLTEIDYRDKNLRGDIKVADIKLPVGDTSRLNASVQIKSLPIDLALASREERFLSGEPVDIQAVTDSLPVAFAGPFLPGVQVRAGTANLRFSVTGNFPDLNYSGDGTVRNVAALVEGNNILYYANAKLQFKEQVLSIEQANIRNDPRDLRDGRATITGHIDFDGFSPKYVDLEVKTPQLMVLSDATQAVSDELYGDLVIASGALPLRFYGSLDRPHLDGDVTVLTGNLRMAEVISPENTTDPVNYIDYADWLRRLDSASPYGPPLPEEISQQYAGADSVRGSAIDSNANPGSLLAENVRVQERLRQNIGYTTVIEKSLTEILQLNLDVEVSGRLFFTLDRSPIEQLRAELATPDRALTIRRGEDGELLLDGILSILPGSKYIFIKTFEATGKLAFVGKLEDTQIGINGTYTGRRLLADNETIQEYQVLLGLNGTLRKPEVRLDYTIDGQPPSRPDQDTRNRNAISLLLFGRPSDELNGTRIGAQVGDLAVSSIGSSASSIASRLITDILAGGTEFIRSVDVDLSGTNSDFTRTKVNVVSQFGRVIVRYGGQISNPTANGTVTIELPLSVLLNVKELNNFVLDLEREARSADENRLINAGTQESEIYRASVQYRKLW